MRSIIVNCLVGLLSMALLLNSLMTGTVFIHSGALSPQNSPYWYWAFIAVYTVAAAVGFYKAVTAYKNKQRVTARGDIVPRRSTLALDGKKTPEPQPLRLGWGRFALLAAMFVIVFAFLTFLPGVGGRPMRLPMALWCVSMLGFFSLRWHSLRKQVLSGVLSPSEFRKDPRRYVLGPQRMALIWFGVTIVVMIGVLISRPNGP